MRNRPGPLATVLVLVVVATTTRAEVPATAVLNRLEIQGEQTQAELVVHGTFAVPSYTVRESDGGRRIRLEVAGTMLAAGGVQIEGSSRLVARTVASAVDRGVLVDVMLSEPCVYRARSDAGMIRVHFEPRQATGTTEVEARAANPQELASDADPRVVRVHIERRGGSERVIIELDRPAPFRVVPGQTSPARLEIQSARLDASVETRLEGERRAVVRAVHVTNPAGRVTIEADRNPGASATAIREGRRIVWIFTPDPGDALRKRRESQTLAREEPMTVTEIEDGSEAAGFLSDLPLQTKVARAPQFYTGRRIDLDFKEADIHNILRLLSEVGNVNIITSDDVQGAVTIRMRDVPWDQALDVILQAKGLGMVRRNNLVRVAPLASLEKERDLAIARRKQQVALSPLETRLVPVSYARGSELQERVRELLSERGSVSVDQRTNILVVRDVAESLNDVEDLVRSLDTQTPQVLIEARIVEASSQFSRDVGVQWGGDVTMSSATGNPTGLVFPNEVTVAGGNHDPQNNRSDGLSPFAAVPRPNFAVNLPAQTGTGMGGAVGLSLGSLGGNVNVNVRLSAAESSGTVRIVSNPRILTLDNHEASIAQGTLIPYSQISAQGVQTAFQEAKLELKVRPHVTSDGAVSMHVQINRDEPDFTRMSTRGDPTILKREAQTNLLVQDGHTAVIGGIYTRNTGRNINQVPFFGDIPILGVFFQHRRATDTRNELLIFLTPRIVNRSEAIRE